MTFEYKTTTLYKQETGVQFCEFRSMKDDNNDLIIDHMSHCSELADIIETYALLLPYKKDNHEFLKQYTLVYWDWDVLVCNTTSGETKGIPLHQKALFSREYIQHIKD